MDLVDDAADDVRKQRLGGGAMVGLALAAYGFSQGAQDRLSDGASQSTKHGGPVEIVSHPDPNCLALALDPASGTASTRNARDCRGFSRDHPGLVILRDIRHHALVTAKQLWHAIVRLGGSLDRKSDGPPG